MYSYRIYGLGVRSEVPLPELTEEEAPTDVIIRLGTIEPPSSDVIAEGINYKITKQRLYLDLQDVGRVLVKGEREIVVDPVPGVVKKVLFSATIGKVLAVLLYKQGHLLLHATTVAIDGGAVILLGKSGQGKSTLAMALYAQGHGMMTDDVTAVAVNKSGGLIVFPGLPLLNLWPDSITSVGEDPKGLPPVHHGFEKRSRPITQMSMHTPLPLRGIYLLDEGNTHKIDLLRPLEAFVELVRHSLLVELLRQLESPSYFLQFTKIVNAVPMRRLTICKSYEALPKLIRMVEEDLALV